MQDKEPKEVRELRVLVDELDDPQGDRPYEEYPGVWICRRCAAEISHRSALCCHCKRADTYRRRQQQDFGAGEEDEEEESDDE